MDFKIINVHNQDSHLAVYVEHYHVDGTLWFTENYTWQGREGLKQKRATDADGRILLTDGTVAPYLTNDCEIAEQYLPEGKSWELLPGPRMDDESILTTIRAIHRDRLVSGWPSTTDTLRPCVCTNKDVDGCDALVSKFTPLVGREE
jgi:hypothetical protein